MGFGIKKTKYGFAPVLTYDVCKKICIADNLNAEHNWDCGEFKIVCKVCYRSFGIKAEAWMEMNEYIASLVHNAKVDLKRGNELSENVSK